MEIGINLPPQLRHKVEEIRRQTNSEVNVSEQRKKLVDTLAKFVAKIDKLTARARNISQDFITNYHESPDKTKESKGWALIREYKAPGTFFEYQQDKIAPNSIVVKHVFYNGELDGTHFFWVSDVIDTKTNSPFVYYFLETDQKDDTVTFEPRLIVMENDDISENSIFSVTTVTPGVFNNIEIWKQGKPEKQKAKSKTKTQASPIPLRQPLPEPVMF